jgi:hypothetical protein
MMQKFFAPFGSRKYSTLRLVSSCSGPKKALNFGFQGPVEAEEQGSALQTLQEGAEKEDLGLQAGLANVQGVEAPGPSISGPLNTDQVPPGTAASGKVLSLGVRER